MKKVLIVPMVLLLATAAAAENRFFLSAGAGFLRPADENYRAIYGNQAIYPEFLATIRVVAGFSLTGSYGQFSRTGTTPELGIETKATQSFWSAGLSYLLRLSDTLCLEAGGGFAGLSFKEEALGEMAEGKQNGFKIDGAILLAPEDERIFLGLRIGYIFAEATDVFSELAGPQTVRLGGARIAVCFGVQLFRGD